MRTLRLTQNSEGGDRYRIQLRLEGDGLAPIEVFSSVSFTLTAQDLEDLRWYLEEYAEFPYDPAPTIAARVEHRMAELGNALFDAVFRSSDDARDLWAILRADLSDTRVEVATDVGSPSIPWELLRDPATDVPLALRARAFVRTVPTPAQRPRLPGLTDGPVRILLVISRPGGGDDVPFRSVASRLIAALGTADERYQLDVLRPATFARLSQVLREAHLRGEPYHVVHFDGHGTYLSYRLQDGPAPLVYGTPRPGSHGYLVFERPTAPDGVEMVDGPTLGSLLAETQVSVLVLNACQSGHAEPLAEPSPAREKEAPSDPHIEVRAYGSLAQEVMDAGVAGVVAMRYNVYVVTAAQFVADLYAALRQGQPVGEAVSLGRKQLDANPIREIAGERVELQDWPVPVVYEAVSLQLFPLAGADAFPRVALRATHAMPERGILDPRLPAAPDVGFFGRDETLLALDRRFDTQRVVLLHAYAGSGKTATAAEFARWYALTGGVAGPVLFTSFEHPRPLARVLDDLEPIFGGMLEQQGIHWLALSDQERRDIALQLLRRVPVLWIWDNVEEVTGFPTPAEGTLSLAEQQELADFLRDARDTEAKFLLTSRRDERAWLGNLPARVELPGMPIHERIHLARALAEKHGRQITDVPGWLPLLRYTEGNPLTLTVVVDQALREGLETADKIAGFVGRLRAGEAELDDHETQGRTRSLGASLNYGFAHAFTEQELTVLALLKFFQTVVNVDVLDRLIHPEDSNSWGFDCSTTLPSDFDKEAVADLCRRAAQVGLLTDFGGTVFGIHPALPWFFAALFKKVYSSEVQSEIEGSAQARVDDRERCLERAFVEATGAIGAFLSRQLDEGNEAVGRALRDEEANLLHGVELARTHDWRHSLIGPMFGLEALYQYSGRTSEWAQLVQRIVPEYVDPADDGPLPEREKDWVFVTSWRVTLAREERNWNEAERLQRLLLDRMQARCAPILAASPETLTLAQRLDVANLATEENALGSILEEQNDVDCVEVFERAQALSAHMGDNDGLARTAFSLGNAYLDVPALKDLNKAEQWYRRALDLVDVENRHFYARILGQLGHLGYSRFQDAVESGDPGESLHRDLLPGIDFYLRGLELLGEDSPVQDRLTLRNQLCVLYNNALRSDLALPHCQEALRLAEGARDAVRAAGARLNMARALAQVDRLEDGLVYAEVAKNQLELYLGAAAPDVQTATRMIEQIKYRLEHCGSLS